MKEQGIKQTEQEPKEPLSTIASPVGKKPWQEPKLAFIEPKLTQHGDLKEVTAGFFGTFVP